MFSPSEIAELDSAYLIPFESFKEIVTAYKTPVTTYVNNGSNWNFAYAEQQPDINSSYVPQSGQFYATVEYVSEENYEKTFFPNVQSPIALERNLLRVSTSGDGHVFLHDCEKLVLDGLNFTKITTSRPRGIVTRQLYEYFFKRTT